MTKASSWVDLLRHRQCLGRDFHLRCPGQIHPEFHRRFQVAPVHRRQFLEQQGFVHLPQCLGRDFHLRCWGSRASSTSPNAWGATSTSASRGSRASSTSPNAWGATSTSASRGKSPPTRPPPPPDNKEEKEEEAEAKKEEDKEEENVEWAYTENSTEKFYSVSALNLQQTPLQPPRLGNVAWTTEESLELFPDDVGDMQYSDQYQRAKAAYGTLEVEIQTLTSMWKKTSSPHRDDQLGPEVRRWRDRRE